MNCVYLAITQGCVMMFVVSIALADLWKTMVNVSITKIVKKRCRKRA